MGTRLQQVIEMHGLKPLQIVREAQRLAAALERPAISRQHFLRFRSGRAAATEDKIYIIVAAMRSLTGLLFRPSDLFELEPPVGGSFESTGCTERTDSVRRSIVIQESGAADRFESLYTEYGLLLRTIAMRRYHVPPDDAEALVHDIFAAYLERSAWPPRSNVPPSAGSISFVAAPAAPRRPRTRSTSSSPPCGR